MPVSNILDPIHETLDPSVWDHADSPEPVLKPHLAQFIRSTIYHALETNGYAKPHEWLNLCLTGSLTTYQYSANSDCDISLFVDAVKLPEWSRAEMVGIMIDKVDGTKLPGAPYELQDFVVGGGLKPADLYRLGLRSGYDLDANRWIVPPDPSHSHDVETQENGFYVYAMEMADKMERLLRYEPNKAVQFWHQIHARRSRDQKAGKGDFAESNIVYKFLANRGLFPAIAEASDEHIAKTAAFGVGLTHHCDNPFEYPSYHKIEARDGNGRLVGAIGFHRQDHPDPDRYDENVINIKSMEVHPELRRQGIGTQMMNEVQRLFPGEINPGGFTPEGAQFWQNRTGEPTAPDKTLQEHGTQAWDLGADYEGRPYEPKVSFVKEAGLTRAQRLRKQQHWNDALGPDYAPVVRQFPDGWSIRRLTTPHAENYEGEMMPNCVGSADSALRIPEHELHQPTSIGSNPEHTYYSVRDPDNLPHATFAHDPEHDKHFFDLELEGRAGANASKYAPYVHDWWTSIGGRPLSPREWSGSTLDNESTTEGMPQVGTPEHDQVEAEPGWFMPHKPVPWWEKEGYGGMPEYIHRAARPMAKAMSMDDESADQFLRQRLVNNFKPEIVDNLVNDFHRHRKDAADYEKEISPDSVKPYHRQEFPEFYWMHGSYGPEAYKQVKEVQENYKAMPWNHPGVWHSHLMNNLIEKADMDPTMAEDVANRWENAHLQAQGQQADRTPMVTIQSPEQQQAWQNFKDVIPAKNHEMAWDSLKDLYTTQVPDPKWDESQAWTQPPKWSPSLGIQPMGKVAGDEWRLHEGQTPGDPSDPNRALMVLPDIKRILRSQPGGTYRDLITEFDPLLRHATDVNRQKYNPKYQHVVTRPSVAYGTQDQQGAEWYGTHRYPDQGPWDSGKSFEWTPNSEPVHSLLGVPPKDYRQGTTNRACIDCGGTGWQPGSRYHDGEHGCGDHGDAEPGHQGGYGYTYKGFGCDGTGVAGGNPLDGWEHKPTVAKVSDVDHQAVLDANAGQDLQGLPGPVNIPGYGPLQFHSDANIQRMAQEYNQQYGIQQQHPTDYSRVNPQIAQQVAQEFDKTPHAPNDPNVQAAYGAFAKEVRQQYDHTVNNGYQFEFYPQGQDPYPNSPREALLDLHHNKHMYVYPTQEGFGAEGGTVGSSDHPMLADSGVRWNGQPVTHNDLFRAIHDVYGHAKEGVGFRADGEENAFRQHAAMFSPLAQRALTTETRGQNNWINYGPYGAQNQNAKTEDTIFAQNRAGLMPEWVGNPELFKSQPQTAKTASVPPITQAEARGNSRPVSHEEFQQLAAEGKTHFDALAARTSPTTGLDSNWDAIKEHAWNQVQQPWGGTTVDAHTGVPLESNADLYALTARPPGTECVSVPENTDRGTFHAAMDQAKAQYQPLLERDGHHIGAFHDDDQHRIDIDPIVVVRSPQEVERLGAYTHAVGGAYHFKSGDGYFPPHVPDTESGVVS